MNSYVREFVVPSNIRIAYCIHIPYCMRRLPYPSSPVTRHLLSGAWTGDGVTLLIDGVVVWMCGSPYRAAMELGIQVTGGGRFPAPVDGTSFTGCLESW